MALSLNEPVFCAPYFVAAFIKESNTMTPPSCGAQPSVACGTPYLCVGSAYTALFTFRYVCPSWQSSPCFAAKHMRGVGPRRCAQNGLKELTDVPRLCNDFCFPAPPCFRKRSLRLVNAECCFWRYASLAPTLASRFDALRSAAICIAKCFDRRRRFPAFPPRLIFAHLHFTTGKSWC